MKMKRKSTKKQDLEEIFLHVKYLKAEQKNSENIPPEDMFEIVEFIGDTDTSSSEEFVSKKIDSGPLIVCDFCGENIVPEKNLAGLVVSERNFACEKCCQEASQDKLNSWTESKTTKPADVKPIALWLMEEKNKSWLFDK
jgi:hypothetical protein